MYSLIIKARNKLYDRGLIQTKRSSLPVICVGNVVVGGSGKTPFTDFIVEILLQEQIRPAILMRGYGGSIAGPHLVAASDKAQEVGDEALLHYNRFNAEVPIVIARDRRLGASFIEYSKNADVIVLDDGYQHRRLERDCNLLLLDVSSEEAISKWRNGALLPFGRLRESLDDAVRRANGIVFVSRKIANSNAPSLLIPYHRFPKNVPLIDFQLAPSFLRDCFTSERVELEKFKGKSVSALTAIANPEIFFQMLKDLNLSVEKTFSFRDHFNFSEKHLLNALECGYPVIVTAKDEIKLKEYLNEKDKLYSLELSPLILEEDREKLSSLLFSLF